jgi:hypothetical protein
MILIILDPRRKVSEKSKKFSKLKGYGRATFSEWGSGGRWFKSSRPDQFCRTAMGGTVGGRGYPRPPEKQRKSSNPSEEAFVFPALFSI